MRAFLKNPGSVTEFSADLLIVPIFADKKLSKASRDTDRALKKQISRLLDAGDFNGKKGETLLLPGVQNLGTKHVMLWGCGDKGSLQRQHWVNACHQLSRALSATKAKHIAIAADFKTPKKVPNSWALQQISTQLTRGNYRTQQQKNRPQKASALLKKLAFWAPATPPIASMPSHKVSPLATVLILPATSATCLAISAHQNICQAKRAS